ncbi:MAG: acyl-CoA synthetase, partial [Saprospiraceae bacterium]|nr:acyl-CoA synthetase [Saprospiraceae bacterium]
MKTNLSFLFQRAQRYASRTAVVDEKGRHSYDSIVKTVDVMARALRNRYASNGYRTVAFLVTPSAEYVLAQWAIWISGGIAVPLAPSHPLEALKYVIDDSKAEIIISDEINYSKAQACTTAQDLVSIKALSTYSSESLPLPDIAPDDHAMILYTSGTTSQPKGVLTTHETISDQIATLVEAWQWSAEDYTLNVLPLHHVHGIINILGCSLWVGGTCEFLREFNAEEVWRKFGKGCINVFMAVPTIYYKLIDNWQLMSKTEQVASSASCKYFRLMVSGSAALPVSILKRWKEITGLTLLERYGMTEIGMALSNPYNGERLPGHVGQPLHGVSVRLVDAHEQPVVPGEPGEIQVKGASVFKHYWQRPAETEAAFTEDGWFRTGDLATLINGSYRILGRNSVDIIKSGGYKISALEI